LSRAGRPLAQIAQLLYLLLFHCQMNPTCREAANLSFSGDDSKSPPRDQFDQATISQHFQETSYLCPDQPHLFLRVSFVATSRNQASNPES
jgi:hypothetical protein